MGSAQARKGEAFPQDRAAEPHVPSWQNVETLAIGTEGVEQKVNPLAAGGRRAPVPLPHPNPGAASGRCKLVQETGVKYDWFTASEGESWRQSSWLEEESCDGLLTEPRRF